MGRRNEVVPTKEACPTRTHRPGWRLRTIEVDQTVEAMKTRNYRVTGGQGDTPLTLTDVQDLATTHPSYVVGRRHGRTTWAGQELRNAMAGELATQVGLTTMVEDPVHQTSRIGKPDSHWRSNNSIVGWETENRY